VPSATAVAVIDQLREFKEVRRGWLGVRIQQVSTTSPPKASASTVRGALVAASTTKVREAGRH